jgi:hypothetical protein
MKEDDFSTPRLIKVNTEMKFHTRSPDPINKLVVIELPSTPTEIIMNVNAHQLLTSYEKSEILGYTKVYYLGTVKAKLTRKSAGNIKPT